MLASARRAGIPIPLGTQFGAIIASGFAPLICTFLWHELGSVYAVSPAAVINLLFYAAASK
ncbi:hypothetical protein [Aneurinibacillus sp. REN35]|uniref:hypothetical protein n=1 Tax=Aneurinibacillus sp. REN35 TaxID=3237286 RepID=UPI0035273FA9